jgi:hypothetical protein
MEGIHVRDNIKTRHLGARSKKCCQASHRSESFQIRSKGTANEEAEGEKLRPKDHRQATVATNEYHCDESTPSKEENTPVRRKVVDLTSCGVVLIREREDRRDANAGIEVGNNRSERDDRQLDALPPF